MDPVTIVQIVGTAVSLGDVVVKCISRLSTLKQTYQDAPIHVSAMIGQLFIVQTALDALSEWNQTGNHSHPRYRQLSSQMGNALDCFGTLIFTLQTQLDRLDASNPVDMPAKSRIRFAWSEKDIANYSALLDRQVNALSLLLQAIQCENWTQQEELLGREESQSVLMLAKDCTSSMLGLDDEHSFISETTADISVTFDFDAFVLGSRVYQLAGKSHLKQAIRAEYRNRDKKTHLTRSITTKDSISRTVSMTVKPQSDNSMSDNSIRGNQNRASLPSSFGDTFKQIIQPRGYFRLMTWWKNSLQRKSLVVTSTVSSGNATSFLSDELVFKKILIFGTSGSGKSTLVAALSRSTIHKEGYCEETRSLFKHAVWSNVIQCTRVVLEAMESLGLPLDDDRKKPHAQTILVQIASSSESPPTSEALQAVKLLWEDEGFQAAFRRRSEYQLCDNFKHYATSIERLMSPEYLPTDEDISRISIKTTEITETKFQHQMIQYRVYDVGGARVEREKWIHVSENVNVVILTIDVCCYGNVLLADESVNRMMEQLTLFEGIVNSVWFNRSEFLVVFTKMDCLDDYPLTDRAGTCFPEYVKDAFIGPVESYMQFLQSRFMNLIKSDLVRDRIRILRTNLVHDIRTQGLAIWNTLDEMVRSEQNIGA